MAWTWNGHKTAQSGSPSLPVVCSGYRGNGWHGHLQLVTASPGFGWYRGHAIPRHGAAGDGAGTRSRRCRGRRRIPASRGAPPCSGNPWPRSRAPGRTAVLFLPSPLASLPAGCGRQDGLDGSHSALRTVRGGEGVRSSAPECPPNPTPKISSNHPAGSCFQHSPSSLRGAAAALPHLPVSPIIAAFLLFSQPAHDSCAQLMEPPWKAPRSGSGTHLRAGTVASATRAAGPASTCPGAAPSPSCAHAIAASTLQSCASRRHRAGRDAGRKGLTHAGVNENKTANK